MMGEIETADEPTRALLAKRVRIIIEREHRDKEHGSEANTVRDSKRKSHRSNVPIVPDLGKKVAESLKKMRQHIRADRDDAQKIEVRWITPREIGVEYVLSEASKQWENFCFPGDTKFICKGEREVEVAMTQANAYAYWRSQGHSSSERLNLKSHLFFQEIKMIQGGSTYKSKKNQVDPWVRSNTIPS